MNLSKNYRLDRILHLKNTAAYDTSDMLDMVFYFPRINETALRFWLMTDAESPIVCIDDIVLKPVSVAQKQPRWIDLGVTDKLSGHFGQLRIYGMSPEQADSSYLVITHQTEIKISGTISDVERKIWGISRSDAGTTMISPSRITAGQPTNFTLRYFSGQYGLPAGSRIRFAVPGSFSGPQVEHPDADGFTSFECTEGYDIYIESAEKSLEAHVAVDIICYLPKGLPPMGNIVVNYKTAFTYLFPLGFYENDRRCWYIKLAPFCAAVAVDDRKIFVSLEEKNNHTVEFVPGRCERLHLFLPGRRKQGKEVYLKGIFTDKYRNIPPEKGVYPRIELYLTDNAGTVFLGTPSGYYKDFYSFQIPLPDLALGVYRVTAINTDTRQVVAISNPLEIIHKDSTEDEIFWGEIHGHSEMSDGSGRYAELYRHAHDVGCLDFAAASDHACYFTDNEWMRMQDITNSWNRPGEFVTLVGYEWAGNEVHRNIYTSNDRLKLFRGMYKPTSCIKTVWDYFKNDDSVVGGPHAPLAHGLKWDYHEPSVERFIEIYSMWGASDSYNNPLVPPFIRKPTYSADELLQQGAHLGFTGGGDCHEGHCGFSVEDPEGQGKVPHTFAHDLFYRCGMTAASMKALDRINLIKAIRNRKTYATTGARILLSFTASGAKMGEIIQSDRVTIDVAVHGCVQIKKLVIIKDGNEVYEVNPGVLDAAFSWEDPDNPVKEHFYYIRVVQEDNQMAWSSPIWISPTTPMQNV